MHQMRREREGGEWGVCDAWKKRFQLHSRWVKKSMKRQREETNEVISEIFSDLEHIQQQKKKKKKKKMKDKNENKMKKED